MKKYFKCLTKMQLISYLLLFLTAFLFNYCIISAMANGSLLYSRFSHPLPSIICNMAMDVLYHTFL